MARRLRAPQPEIVPRPESVRPPARALALQVKMMTGHLACGHEVTIDLEPNATKEEIKAKLVAVTGVPAEHQKVMLSGINQIVMGDKR